MSLQVYRNNRLIEAGKVQTDGEETVSQNGHPVTAKKTEEILERLRNRSALGYGYAMAIAALLDDTRR